MLALVLEASFGVNHNQPEWKTIVLASIFNKVWPSLHTYTRCGHANTRQTPCGWHDEALGVGVKTPRQAMKNNVMWLGAFLHTHTHTLMTGASPLTCPTQPLTHPQHP